MLPTSSKVSKIRDFLATDSDMSVFFFNPVNKLSKYTVISPSMANFYA